MMVGMDLMQVSHDVRHSSTPLNELTRFSAIRRHGTRVTNGYAAPERKLIIHFSRLGIPQHPTQQRESSVASDGKNHLMLLLVLATTVSVHTI
jgi:hypothetical protein